MELHEMVDDIFRLSSEDPPEEWERKAIMLMGLPAPIRQQVVLSALQRLAEQGDALVGAREALAELHGIVDKLTEAPWYPATLQAIEHVDGRPMAKVLRGSERSMVGLAEGVESETLVPGDEVYLSAEKNVLLGRSPAGPVRYGATAQVEGYTADGRFLLRYRDSQLVVPADGPLVEGKPEPGTMVRFDPHAWLVLEPIERPESDEYTVDEVEPIEADAVGGQEANLKKLLDGVRAAVVDSKLAEQYDLDGRNGILMWGPQGCGKTLMSRVAAAELERVTGRKARICVVKPGQWDNMWYGETARHIRQTFELMRSWVRAGAYAILFLDEVESIGRIRGGAVGQHADRHLAALLAELDGFFAGDRAGIVVIAATNRPDLLDPALQERLGEEMIQVGRPDAAGARAILGIHLPPSVPYGSNGTPAAETRQTAIEHAVARLYAPNGDNEVARLMLRDGRERTVLARELISGRIIAQVCRAARRAALIREVEGGSRGVTVDDVERAICVALSRLRQVLSPVNARDYLADLPQHVDVVSVEPCVPRVERPLRYVHVA